MRTQKLLGWFTVAALAVLFSQGDAGAQAQGMDVAQQAPAAGARPAATPGDQLSQADTVIARLEVQRAAINKQLVTARGQRDVVKTLCLDDKLNQIDVALRSARDRRKSLDAAARRNDVDLANHESTIVMVLQQRGDQLTAEANQCIGQEAGYIGEAAVKVSIDPTLPDDEQSVGGGSSPTGGIPGTGTVTDIPVCASCFK